MHITAFRISMREMVNQKNPDVFFRLQPFIIMLINYGTTEDLFWNATDDDDDVGWRMVSLLPNYEVLVLEMDRKTEEL